MKARVKWLPVALCASAVLAAAPLAAREDGKRHDRKAKQTSQQKPPKTNESRKGTTESDEVLFARMDTNHDGKLSQEEWTAAKKSMQEFSRLDSNHDGVLSPFEFGVGR